MKIGLIGYGYWGPNLVRNLNALASVNGICICDIEPKRLIEASKQYTGVPMYKNYKEMLRDVNLDAVLIATPAHTHFSIAQDVIKSNLNLLVEKPLALRRSECEDLILAAQKKGVVLMVGHTFIYNAAVRFLKKIIEDGELGKIYYIYSQRLNLGRVRPDINAMWNFAPHDISILLYWLKERPLAVTARGMSYLQNGIEDVVFLDIEYENKISAHIHISWIDPSKVRKMTIVGSKKMAIYDDVTTDGKVKIFDKGIDVQTINSSFGNFKDFGEFQLISRAGDVYVPKIDFEEPIKVECEHFLDCIMSNKKPITDGQNGLEVVGILESAQASLSYGSKRVMLKARDEE